MKIRENNTSTLWATVGFFCCSLGAAGSAAAQDLPTNAGAPTDDSAPKETLNVVAEPATNEPPIESVPDGEKSERASKYVNTMKSTLRQVLRYLEEAREERDVVKLNCINEKLTAVKGLLRVSEASDLALQEALARRDSDAAAHEYEKIAIAGRKIDRLRSESESCVGELAVYSGDTEVEVVVTSEPPAPVDPAAGAIPVDVVVRPPASSPSQ